MLARRAGAIPTTSFISRVSARHFELPENRLLVWLLSDLARSVSRIEHSVGSNSLHPELALIRDASNGAKAHNWLAGITAPERPDKGDLFQAERSRNWSYRLAAKLARRRLEAEAADRGAWWHSVLTLLSVNWLEPVDEDDLFELYALVLIIDILAKDLGFGTPIEYGLVTKGRKHVASFSTHEMTVRVYFDQATSSVVGLSSNYTKVIKAHYGVTGAERRPDILISVNSAAGESWHIVEVKRSSDGRYISDSIYKVFGYLFDQEGSANISSALLLVPTGVFAHNGAENSTFVYLASGDDRSGTATALASMLEQHGKLSKR